MDPTKQPPATPTAGQDGDTALAALGDRGAIQRVIAERDTLAAQLAQAQQALAEEKELANHYHRLCVDQEKLKQQLAQAQEELRNRTRIIAYEATQKLEAAAAELATVRAECVHLKQELAAVKPQQKQA